MNTFKETKKCPICNNDFICYKSDPKITCSKKCKFIRQRTINQGANNPHWHGGKVIKNCLICNKEFIAYPPNMAHKRKFCSMNCLTEHKRTIFKLDKHPSWNGGKIIRKGYIFILQNINGKNCYIKEHRLVMEKLINRKLLRNEIVHHINHNRMDNSIDNLILFPNHSIHIIYHFVEHWLFFRILLF